jgi:hypothetical protein
MVGGGKGGKEEGGGGHRRMEKEEAKGREGPTDHLPSLKVHFSRGVVTFPIGGRWATAMVVAIIRKMFKFGGRWRFSGLFVLDRPTTKNIRILASDLVGCVNPRSEIFVPSSKRHNSLWR